MPEQAYLRLGDDRPDTVEVDLKLLYGIYTYEATRVSGTHGGLKRFSDCMWSVDDAFKSHMERKLNRPWNEFQPDFENLVAFLSSPDQRHMMRFEKDGEMYHLSRLAESIRTSGNLHEFQNREVPDEDGEDVSMKFNIIEGTEWYPILRYGTPREFPPSEIVSRLQQKLDGIPRLAQRAGGHSIEDAFADLQLVMEGVGDVPKYRGNGLRFSEFQVDSIVTSLMQSWTDSTGEGLVITADTGMGKTLAFGIPVLVDAVMSLRNEAKSMNQLILYPRNALAADQYNEFKTMASYVNKALQLAQRPQLLGVAIDSDGKVKTTRQGEQTERYANYPLPQGRDAQPWGVGTGNVFEASKTIYGGNAPAQIILASIESFRRRLRNPTVVAALGNGLRRIVFDEVHLSSGAQGGHHHFLVSRLKQLGYRRENRVLPRIVGVSATIAKPRQHLHKLWGGRLDNIRHVGGRNSSDGTPVSLMHHVMYKARTGTPMIGVLVDLSSSILHQRRPPGIGRPELSKPLQKTIGFSDSHQIVGDWYSFMLDNESTSDQNQTRRLAANPGSTLRKPYAHWHDRPLRRHAGGDEVCATCKGGEYHAHPIELTGDECRTFHQTNPSGAEPEKWDLPGLDLTETYQIAGLDSCQYLEHGKCWWFASKEDNITPRPGSQAYTSYADVIRTKRYTSITKKGEGNNEEDASGGGANQLFRSKAKYGAYPNLNTDAAQNENVLHDFVIATPTLEVGVDMDNVSEVLTHKAIRNISSYRQKVGRAGRENGSDALAVTLASRRASDFQHFRSMHRLVAEPISEPVPVAVDNTTILKHHAYEAVFDYLSKYQGALELELIPPIRRGQQGWDELNNKIQSAKNALDDARCRTYVQYALGIRGTPEIAQQAITIVKDHLDVLLITFTFRNSDDSTFEVSLYQWLCHFRQANQRLKGYDPNDGNWTNLDNAKNALENMDLAASLEVFIDERDEEFADVFESPMLPWFTNWVQEYIAAVNFRDVQSLRQLRNEFMPIFDPHRFLNPFAPPGNVFAQAIAFIENLQDAEPIHPMIRMFRDLVRRRNTWYLSNVMEVVPKFLESRPFVALPSYFTNPHEGNVRIKDSFSDRTVDTVTASEAIKYLLPGMHTRRLGFGNRMMVQHTLVPEFNDDHGVFTYDLADESGIKCTDAGQLSGLERDNISPLLGLRITDIVYARELTELRVKAFPGVPDQGRNFCLRAGMEDPMRLLIGFQDSDDRGGQMLIPKSYCTKWSLVADGEGEVVQTYEVSGATGDRVRLPVTHQPLMNHLFSSITFHHAMEVKQLGLGVARSNGVMLQPEHNTQTVAFVHRFETQGLRFKLSDHMKAALEERVAQDGNTPFSAQTLQLLDYIIRHSHQDLGHHDGFIIEAYLDVLVDNAWRLETAGLSAADSFPETEADFLELLFESGHPLSPESVQRRAQFSAVANDALADDIQESLNAFIPAFSAFYNGTVKPELSAWRKRWYGATLANTMGVLLADAITEYAGVQGGSVAYATTLQDDEWSIEVYDNEPEGNGSCNLARNYFHIPIEVRQAAHYFGERNLPSESLCDVLERRLMVCMEHELHHCAIQSDEAPQGAPAWFAREQMTFNNRFSEAWEGLSIESPRDANLHMMRRWSIREPNDRGALLALELALHLCDDGCTACEADGMLNQYPPHLAPLVTSRGLLDAFVGPLDQVPGYANLTGDRATLRERHGSEVADVEGLLFVPEDRGATDLRVRFIHHLGVSIGYSAERHRLLNEEVDILVRHQEVV